MVSINMHDAKTQLSDLVARAEAGEEIVIARRNKPAVRLVRVEVVAPSPRPRRVPGALAHLASDPPPNYERIFEHAPDDYISKEDIAAYYRKHPEEWGEMRGMVGFGEDKQSDYDAGDLLRATEGRAGRITIMRDGKPVAKVVPVERKSRGWGAWEGRYTLPNSFFDPLPEEGRQRVGWFG